MRERERVSILHLRISAHLVPFVIALLFAPSLVLSLGTNRKEARYLPPCIDSHLPFPRHQEMFVLGEVIKNRKATLPCPVQFSMEIRRMFSDFFNDHPEYIGDQT